MEPAERFDIGADRAARGELTRLAHARDVALVSLGSLYLSAAVLYAWVGQPVPTFSVAVFVLLPIVALSTENLYAARPRRWTATLMAGWPVFMGPLVYFAQVRVLEIDRSRYIDAFLLRIDGWLQIHEAEQRFWAPGGLLEEIANALYVSYYAVPLVVLWLTLRRGPLEGARATAALSITTFVCGVIWIALPSGGYYPSGGPTCPGLGPFTAFAHGIYATHPHFAAAFPSEHVAHAAAFAVVMRRMGTGAWIWLWVLGVALSTVIGQYHFAADGLMGWIVGVAAATAAPWFARDRSTGVPLTRL